MRFSIFIGLLIAAGQIQAQENNPYQDILRHDQPPMTVAKDDEKLTALLKAGYNASYFEVRTKYHYWQQAIIDLDPVLASLDRFQSYRLELEGEMDALKFAKQKLEFVKVLEEQCAKGKWKKQSEPRREVDEKSAIAYRISVEIEIERLSLGDAEQR